MFDALVEVIGRPADPWWWFNSDNVRLVNWPSMDFRRTTTWPGWSQSSMICTSEMFSNFEATCWGIQNHKLSFSNIYYNDQKYLPIVHLVRIYWQLSIEIQSLTWNEQSSWSQYMRSEFSGIFSRNRCNLSSRFLFIIYLINSKNYHLKLNILDRNWK